MLVTNLTEHLGGTQKRDRVNRKCSKPLDGHIFPLRKTKCFGSTTYPPATKMTASVSRSQRTEAICCRNFPSRSMARNFSTLGILNEPSDRLIF